MYIIDECFGLNYFKVFCRGIIIQKGVDLKTLIFPIMSMVLSYIYFNLPPRLTCQRIKRERTVQKMTVYDSPPKKCTAEFRGSYRFLSRIKGSWLWSNRMGL